jgi:hypothetical protein
MAYQMVESIVPIFVGLMIGWWVLRRKPKTPQELLQVP